MPPCFRGGSGVVTNKRLIFLALWNDCNDADFGGPIRLHTIKSSIMRASLVYVGLLLAVISPIGLTLLLMPIVPSMQMWDSLPLSYALNKGHWIITAAGVLLVVIGLRRAWTDARWWSRTLMVLATLLCVGIHVMYNTKMSAEAMFNEPSVVVRQDRSVESLLADTTVYLWVRQGESIAGYSLDLVAHHHKILDTVGGAHVMVTYCTMCHTGRVFSPVVQGTLQSFRLVGANKFNAVFEDASTGSWWYQATGECVVGPSKGNVFTELEAIHGTYAEMSMVYHPSQTIRITTFVPDAASANRVEWSRGYSNTVGDTTSSAAPRALVLGVRVNGQARSYPLADLVRTMAGHVMVDTIGGTTIAFRVPNATSKAVVVFKDSLGSGALVNSTVEYRRSWNAFNQ
jgi:hypothetical protein